MDELGLARLLRTQDGVITRRQVIGLGGSGSDIRRRRRRREWAAVLACGHGAVLHRESALDSHGLTRDRSATRSVVHVAVDASRSVQAPEGVRLERIRDLAGWLPAERRPPCSGVGLAVLKVASRRNEAGAIAVLADACRQGLTTPARLQSALGRLPRPSGRARMTEVLGDVASGAHSVLEQRYLARVERAHGLPRGERQRREVTAQGLVLREVLHADEGALVELDGRFGHSDSDDRWDDLDRDLTATTTGRISLRLGWRQVLDPCRLAAAVGTVLRARGWDGHPRPCGEGCGLDGDGSGSPGDPNPPPTPRTA